MCSALRLLSSTRRVDSTDYVLRRLRFLQNLTTKQAASSFFHMRVLPRHAADVRGLSFEPLREDATAQEGTIYEEQALARDLYREGRHRLRTVQLFVFGDTITSVLKGLSQL